MTINFVETRIVKILKKTETVVAKTTSCPGGAKICLMSNDGQQKYASFEDQVPVGDPLITTSAKN